VNQYQLFAQWAILLANTLLTRDVPDIWFRLAGYPAIFCYPVPLPDPAKILPVAA